MNKLGDFLVPYLAYGRCFLYSICNYCSFIYFYPVILVTMCVVRP